MGKRYKNAPIVEAVCEFRFEPGKEWDITLPGLLYEKVRFEFPKKKSVRRVEISTKPRADEVQHIVTDLVQFLREDGKALIHIAPNLLAVNLLPRYTSWDEFQPMILDNLAKYREVAEPKGIKRIGLRYINRIEVPIKPVKLEDYFNFYPHLGERLPKVHDPFIAGVHLLFEDGRDMLKLEVKSAQSDPDRPDIFPILLDLDYFLNRAKEVSLDNVSAWIETAHTHVEEIFEACIKDKLRELFGEIK